MSSPEEWMLKHCGCPLRKLYSNWKPHRKIFKHVALSRGVKGKIQSDTVSTQTILQFRNNTAYLGSYMEFPIVGALGKKRLGEGTEEGVGGSQEEGEKFNIHYVFTMSQAQCEELCTYHLI